MRRAAVELGAFLQADAPDAGHDPTVLRREHPSGLSPTSATAPATACRPWAWSWSTDDPPPSPT